MGSFLFDIRKKFAEKNLKKAINIRLKKEKILKEEAELQSLKIKAEEQRQPRLNKKDTELIKQMNKDKKERQEKRSKSFQKFRKTMSAYAERAQKHYNN